MRGANIALPGDAAGGLRPQDGAAPQEDSFSLIRAALPDSSRR